MKFTKTYKQTSWNSFYKPYYYINNKRVSGEKFEITIMICRFKNMNYNSSYMTNKNNRYKAVFYYN